MFLGANDGFDLRSAAAGGRPAAARLGGAYSSRVEAMMRSYLRGGRSRVYWLTLPAPRPAPFARVFPRVNDAIGARPGASATACASSTRCGLHARRRFRQTITFHGQTIDARQPDGMHLSSAGASVAATLVVDRLRADGALP